MFTLHIHRAPEYHMAYNFCEKSNEIVLSWKYTTGLGKTFIQTIPTEYLQVC